MKSELLKRAEDILTAISNEVNQGTLSQLPDIAIQHVMYGRAYNTVISVTLLLLTLLGSWMLVRVSIMNSRKMSDNDYGGWADARFAAGAFGFAIIALFCPVFFITLSDFLMVWFAPKVWLIQEIARLVK